MFKYKINVQVNVVKYTERMVIRIFQHKHDIDYKETFALTCKHQSLRAVLAIAPHMDPELKQYDIKTAFLYEDLEVKLYMMQP